mgnify:CR=1 FL=1
MISSSSSQLVEIISPWWCYNGIVKDLIIMETVDQKRAVEILSERLGKTQDYL